MCHASLDLLLYEGGLEPGDLSVSVQEAMPLARDTAGPSRLAGAGSRAASEVMFPSRAHPVQFTEDRHVPGSVQNGPLCLPSLICSFQAGNFSHHCKRFLSSPCHLAGAQWDFLEQESGHQGFNWALGKFCQETVFCAARAKEGEKIKNRTDGITIK